ncbi:MAG: DUF1592 domain-containing protein [Verrucomicrobiales bacterium]
MRENWIIYGFAVLGLEATARDLDKEWEREVFPLLEYHCYDCHGDGLKKGELALDDFQSITDMQADRERWKRIRTHIDQRLMPPLDEEQPTPEERRTMVDWIDAAVFPVDPDHPDPGRVTLRRLNRIEYENTLRDLLGVTVQVKDQLPPDDSGYGFDNIGDVLTLSPAHLERLLATARLALDEALDRNPTPPHSKSHQAIFGERQQEESNESWATRIFKSFAKKAFRRPLDPGEAERYLHFISLAQDEGRSFEQGVRHGLEAILISPSFLFREEPQPEPDNPNHIHAVNEHTLASRLSYFLWSTMPDRELTQLADQGTLRENLDEQVDRMLSSPRARQFVDHFTGQWLQLRDLRATRPSNRAFPDFDQSLRGDMARETRMLFSHLVRHDRPITDLIDANYTFVNERLADHYGLAGVEGDEFQQVSLDSTPRRGILGHGSFLLVTSHPSRTSPVLRGKYVLENLLDMAPPPPPPNVPQLTSPKKHGNKLTLRQQMEKHRDDPGCASCHALMDPIGFGLQNYDADGSWRSEEHGKPIDVSGELDGGLKFHGADELRSLLLHHYEEEFLRSVASKMLTYALGRGSDWFDKPAIDQIVNHTQANELGTRAMIRAVIDSVPFQYRRGDS